jgi:ABC-type nitrate/sulfonate/bicarbonate transport system substrate-binding protein
LTLLVAAAVASACLSSGETGVERRIRVAGGETPNFADVPTLVAERRLAADGYTIEHLGFAQAELAVEALARGAADVSFGAIATYWAAALRGAPVVTVMEQARTRHQLVARVPIRVCADLHGRTVAVNSLGAAGGNLFKAYVAEACPGTVAQMLVMPRPANRSAALLAGAIDAALVLREHALRLVSQSAGGLVVIEDFARRWPLLATVGMYVNLDFARRNPRAVEDFIRAQLDVIRELGADPIRLADAARRELGDADDVAGVAEAFVRAEAWDPAGGLTPATVDATVRFLLDTGSLTGPVDAARVVDLSYLDRVRAEDAVR